MTPEGHRLSRAADTTWLCQCGFAIMMAKDQRDAEQRWHQHTNEVRSYLDRMKDSKGRQTTADFDNANGQHWSSPFRETFAERWSKRG